MTDAATLNATLKDLQRRFGADVVRPLRNLSPRQADALPTGFDTLDAASCIGGWPRGAVSVLHGEATSGAATLAYHALASAQKNGDAVLLFDLPRTFDADYAVFCGVDVERLPILQPEIDDALRLTDDLLRLTRLGLILLDWRDLPPPPSAQITRIKQELIASRCVLLMLGAWTEGALRLRCHGLDADEAQSFRAQVEITHNHFAPIGDPVTLQFPLDTISPEAWR